MREYFQILYLALGEWPRLPSTARIERPPLHRGGSASKKGTWPLPFSPPSLLVIAQEWGLIDLPLRVSTSSLLPLEGSLVDPRLHASNEHILIVRAPTFYLEGGLDGLPLRVSNEGLLRPRVARAQETV